ncbi:MAG TPA: ABC transporter permease subunit, partial [Alicyclobacillus sp.]|nr:ABC transporter permease subunit [Alicyclobacillus sp.]
MGVHFRWEVIRDYWPLILQGTLVTIEVTVIAVLAGTLLGLILGLMRLGRGWWWRWPALAYITFFRGTPLFVQILLLHFAVIPQF